VNGTGHIITIECLARQTGANIEACERGDGQESAGALRSMWGWGSTGLQDMTGEQTD
jgi:hypothetical protein